MISKAKKTGHRKIAFLSIFLLIASSSSLYGVAASDKAKEKLAQNREYIVELEVALENFGTDDQLAKYGEIKDGYLTGLSYFLQQKYVGAYNTLLENQKSLEKLYEELSMDYIERTNEMLHGIAKQYVDINIKYDFNSELVRRYEVDREAPIEPISYDPKNHHLSYDKHDIYNNIKVGYFRLADAERVRKYALELEKWYEEDKELDHRVHAIRIENYSIAINLCREAKLNVVRSYQLMNRNDIYTVQTELRDNQFAIESRLDPVFDPRIPDEYKVDASDALRKIHSTEVYVKVEKGTGEPPRREVEASSSSGGNSGAANDAPAADDAPAGDSN